MEFPKPTWGLICQEDLELSLAALHPVHQETRQLRGIDQNFFIKILRHLLSWGSEIEFRLWFERGNKVLLVHGEAVWGEDLHQGRRHIVGGHAVRLGGVHLEIELEYFF